MPTEARQDTGLSGYTPYPLARPLLSFLLFVFLHVFLDELYHSLIHAGVLFKTRYPEPPVQIIGNLSYSHLHAVNLHHILQAVKINRTPETNYFHHILTLTNADLLTFRWFSK